MKTKINKANTSSESLRTTIPKTVRDTIGLKEGDTLKWSISIENNEFIIKIKKI